MLGPIWHDRWNYLDCCRVATAARDNAGDRGEYREAARLSAAPAVKRGLAAVAFLIGIMPAALIVDFVLP
jgi:hypothetical protein